MELHGRGFDNDIKKWQGDSLWWTCPVSLYKWIYVKVGLYSQTWVTEAKLVALLFMIANPKPGITRMFPRLHSLHVLESSNATRLQNWQISRL